MQQQPSNTSTIIQCASQFLQQAQHERPTVAGCTRMTAALSCADLCAGNEEATIPMQPPPRVSNPHHLALADPSEPMSFTCWQQAIAAASISPAEITISPASNQTARPAPSLTTPSLRAGRAFRPTSRKCALSADADTALPTLARHSQLVARL